MAESSALCNLTYGYEGWDYLYFFGRSFQRF